MDKTLDDIAGNEITRVHAAKNIAPYLRARAPELPSQDAPPRLPLHELAISTFYKSAFFFICVIGDAAAEVSDAYLFLTDRKGWNKEKEYAREEEKVLQHMIEADQEDKRAFAAELDAYGLTTQQEKDAYTVVQYASMALSSCIWLTDPLKQDGVAVTKRVGTGVDEIVGPRSVFERYLAISVKDGVFMLNAKHGASYQGDSETERQAAAWLRAEVYSRLGPKNGCGLLDRIAVADAGNGLLRMGLRD